MIYMRPLGNTPDNATISRRKACDDVIFRIQRHLVESIGRFLYLIGKCPDFFALLRIAWHR